MLNANATHARTVFMVLSSWQSYCQSSPVHLMIVHRWVKKLCHSTFVR